MGKSYGAGEGNKIPINTQPWKNSTTAMSLNLSQNERVESPNYYNTSQ